MRSWKAVTLTSGTKAYWIFGAMISTIITARFLGPQGRGVIAAATSWVAMFVSVGHLSLAQVVIYVAGRNDRERVLPIAAGSVMAITAATTLLSWTIAGSLYLFTGGAMFPNLAPAVLLIAFAGLPFLLWMENGNSLLIVLGDLKRLNLAQVAGTTAGILLVTFAVGVARRGIAAALAATLVSYIIIVSVGLARVLRDSTPLAVSRTMVRELLRGGARLHLGVVWTFFFTNAAVILLNQFRSAEETAYFQLAMQLTIAIQVVPMAVAIVAYSIVARDGADLAWPEHRNLILQTMLYATVAAAASYAFAPFIVPLIAGPEFGPAIRLVRILSLAVFGMSLATVMAPQWVARGYFLRVSSVSLVAGAISIAANFLLVPKHGMIACAWVMVAAYSVHFASNAAFAWWITQRSRPEAVLQRCET